MTYTEVMSLLRTKIEEAGSQRLFAQQARVSQSYLCDVLNGHRKVGPTLLEALHLQKDEDYIPKDT